MEMMISPPSRYPDLFAVLNVLISTPVFMLTWLWSIKCGVEVGWALSGLGSISPQTNVSEDAGAAFMSNGIRARAVSLGYAQSKRQSKESIRSRGSSVTPG